jgi:hypothetical protein
LIYRYIQGLSLKKKEAIFFLISVENGNESEGINLLEVKNLKGGG